MDDIVEFLLKESEETIQASKLLYDNGFYGDAINRVYYAMIYVAKALLAKKGSYPKTHKGTINLFGKEFVNSGEIRKETFKLLTKSQDNRNKADYY